MQDTDCIWFNEICREDVPLAGGKGANLGDMAQAGLPIPPGYVICPAAFRQMLKGCELDGQINELMRKIDRHNFEHLQTIEHEARRLVEEATFPEGLRAEVLEAYRALGDSVPVAVRSSATAEDCIGASFAGQQETFLNVVGEQALLTAIKRCWSSLYTPQAMFYRAQHGFDSCAVSMGVVVQKLINSNKSGVIFTVDPVFRNHFQMIVEAVWGLGEGIVSGTITPDHYLVDRETYEIVSEFVPPKQIMIIKNGVAGIQQVAVPSDRAALPVLTPNELRRLVDLGNKVERHFGSPQDIEWGIEAGEIYLLQSRPITSL
jgi:pyruvate, water dikinase